MVSGRGPRPAGLPACTVHVRVRWRALFKLKFERSGPGLELNPLLLLLLLTRHMPRLRRVGAKNAKNQTQNCHGVDRPKSAPDLTTSTMSDLLLSEGATIKAKEADHLAFLISDVVIPDGTPRLDVVASLADAGIYTTEDDLVYYY